MLHYKYRTEFSTCALFNIFRKDTSSITHPESVLQLRSFNASNGQFVFSTHHQIWFTINEAGTLYYAAGHIKAVSLHQLDYVAQICVIWFIVPRFSSVFLRTNSPVTSCTSDVADRGFLKNVQFSLRWVKTLGLQDFTLKRSQHVSKWTVMGPGNSLLPA